MLAGGSMELSLEKLDDIYNMLILSYEKSLTALKSIDFSETIPPSPEKRSLLNLMLDQMSGYLLEVSHVDSFLQHCDLNNTAITATEQKTIIACQQLCKDLKESASKVLQWVMQMKEQFNESGCPVPDDVVVDNSLKKSPYFIENETTISDRMFQNYQQFREILKDIHQDLLFTDPKNMIEYAGKRLELANGKSMFVETEHEMNVLMDYGLFQYHKNGNNIAERYYNLRHELYSGQKLETLRALKNTKFSFLQIIKPLPENGLVVKDLLTDETFLMIDTGLCKVAQLRQNHAILTHYLRMPEFIMTTGASTPVLLNSQAGETMWQIFERLVSHHHGKTTLDQKTYLQCITDLFKIAIHKNIAKSVSSRGLPMNYHQMNRQEDTH